MTYQCNCDFDPPSLYRKMAIAKSRKVHKCEECRRTIPAGHGYVRHFFVYEDYGASTFVWCKDCAELDEWARVSVPCFCGSCGNLHEDVREMVQEVAPDVPGFFMEYGRRMVKIRRNTEPTP